MRTLSDSGSQRATLRAEIAAVLIDIEAELRNLDLWQAQAPSPEALASQQPFAVDTLTFPQWLQFIFLPRMYQLLEAQAPLPGECGIAPMAEEYFRGSKVALTGLLASLETVDVLLSGGAVEYGVKR